MKRVPRRGLAALLSLLLAGQLCPLAPAASPDVSIAEDVFPDPVFRQWLADPANLDGAGTDGVFTQEELADIRSINVSSLGISSLEGIEVFSALEELSCKDNDLTALDVRSNTALRYLQCDYNRIASLDVSGLDHLKALYCEHNRMDTLNLNGCTALETIYCRSNDLKEVDFSTNTSLKFIESFDNQLTEVDLSMLSQLEFVHLDHNRLTHLDLSRNPSLTDIGSGFVARNNHLETLTIPNRPGHTVDWDVYREQDPKEGYERVEWYYDPQYTQPVEESTLADGRTLYAKWLPNDYTIRFDAGSGFGSMEPVAAVWGTPVTLPAQSFRRTGYTFDCWKNTYGDGARYQDGAQVTNLAGKIQGDKVTLYAQWTPITYKVAFQAGSGSGSMAPQTLTYDQDTALSGCTLTAPSADLEFAGWSRTPGGPVVFRDREAVRNLTSVQGETVTLYAVWATPVLHQYLEQLGSTLARYDDTSYTAQDRAALEAVYRQASQALLAAGNEGEMVRICAAAEQDMAAVPDVPARTQTVLALWQQENRDTLALADRAVVDESNAAGILQSVQAASDGPDASFVAGHTDLSDSADQALVAQLALAGARNDLNALRRLAEAADWAAKLDGISLRPMAQVTSQTLSAYQAAQAEASTYAAQLSADLTAALRDRASLALCKQQSAEKLLSAYQSYDLSQYSEQAQAQLDAIRRQGTAVIEAAESEPSVASALDKALNDLRSVPVKTPDTQPGGGDSGGGGSAGGGAGGGTGSEPVTPPDQTPPPWNNPYTDVSKNDWFYDSVAYVSANGIMNGYADGTFAPGRNLSRAQLAQLLYNLEGRPASAAVRYTDAQAGAWYESAVSWAAKAGILTGYADGSIRPNDSITRQQLAAMLYRYARYTGRDVSRRADLGSYTDTHQIAPYALEAMQWANAAGILNGSGDALLPGGTATRAQTAAMLTRFCTGEA